MSTLIKQKQLDMAGISGALLAAGFVSGEVVRPSQTGQFITDTDNSAFEAQVQGQILNISGLVEASGRYLLTGRQEISGQYLLGLLFTSGQNLFNLGTGISPSVEQTGIRLTNLISGLSGAFDLSGLNLFNRGAALSGTVNTSGALLESKISGLSGAVFTTGQTIVNLVGSLSGTFNQSGLNLETKINNLTGSLNLSGARLFTDITNLTGTLNLTGAQLLTNIANLTGTLNLSGIALRNDLNSLLAGATTVGGLSGAVTITGSGIVVTTRQGQTIYVSGSSLAASVGRIVSINGQTGNLFITGAGSISVITLGTGIYVSGDVLTASQTGQFAASGDLTASGITLLNRDDTISGYLLNQIVASNAGVSSLNGQSGVLNLVGTGNVIITTGAGQILISGSSAGSVPNWLSSSPDIFTAASFDDDFDTPYLANKWTGININVDSSGISNSHLWLQGKASANNALSNFTGATIILQGATTGADWQIMTKFNFLPRFVNFNSVGLIIGNASSTKNTIFGYIYNSASDFGITHYNTYNNAAGTAAEGGFSGYANDFKNAYFRLQSRSNAMNFDYSNDATIWRTIRNFTYTGNATSVNQVGFFVNPNGSQVGLAVDYFRATGLT